MRSKIGKICAIFLIAVMVFLAACESLPVNKTQAPIEITDQLGRVVTLDHIPQRIISIAPSNTEILYALGLEDRVVAVTKYCDYPPEAQLKPNIGGYTTPNIEEIVALAPDLILATSIHKDTIIPQLENKGLAVFALAPQTLEDILESIRLVGEVTGKEKEAAGLLADMEARIKAVTDITSALPEAERPGVFYLTWHDPLKASGVGTLHHELIQKAGGRNIFAEITGTQSVDLEQVLARDPQVMIAGVGMGSGEDSTYQYLINETRLKGTAAGQSGRIYKIDLDLTGRAGPRIVEGLEEFARCIHPEIFK